MGFIVILSEEVGSVLFHFRNEGALRTMANADHQGGKRKSDYSDADVLSFKYDVANGAKIIEAAKEHGIPVTTARGLVPKIKKTKDRVLAVSLLKKKISGEIDISFRSIARKSGYTDGGILRIKKELT